jgi:hypothetical protein
VLIFLLAPGKGYATEMARFFETDLYGIQSQLVRFETGGVLVSRKVGRTRVFSFNPQYAILDELRALRGKALSFYPEGLREQLIMIRRRPRLRGRPL